MQAPWFQHRKTHGTHLNKAAICTKNPTKTVWTWTENLNTQLRCNIQWWQTQRIECAVKLSNECINWWHNLLRDSSFLILRFQKPLHSQMGKLGVEARFWFWTPVLLFWKPMIIMCTISQGTVDPVLACATGTVTTLIFNVNSKSFPWNLYVTL